MTRIDIINHFIKKYNYKSYLEVGVQNGISFKGVNLPIENKVGVDPDLNSRATIYLTSDEFFKENKKTFDIIFIDGMHEADFVYRDIINSLKILNEGGVILCHDCLPFDEDSQKVPRMTKRWTGDCWKAFVKLRYERRDLKMKVVDTDCGVGIIHRGEQVTLTRLVYKYGEFELDKTNLLNLISIEDFKQQY
jgi:hypothetical protein